MKKTLARFCAMILAVSPLFDPYILFRIHSVEISILDVLIVIAAGMILFLEKQVRIHKALITMLVLFFAINLLSFVFELENRSFVLSLRVLLIWMIYAVLVSILWQRCEKESFIKLALWIGILSSFFILIQIIALSMNYEQVWNGRIPFLQLSEYDDWAKLRDVTGVIRPHAFFQEPSYFTIYLLPLIAYSLQQKKWILFMFFAISAILSTSSIALAMIFAIVVIFAFQSDIRRLVIVNKTKVIAMFFAIAGFILILYFTVAPFQEMVDFSIQKIAKLGADLKSDRMGSAKLRLIGNIGIFSEYSLWSKFFGLGANQYPLVFPKLISYSNSFVTTLLNFGVLGAGTLVAFFGKLLTHMSKNFKIFALLFILICFVDLFWFNWFFFYVLTWVVLFSVKEELVFLDVSGIKKGFSTMAHLVMKGGKRYDK